MSTPPKNKPGPKPSASSLPRKKGIAKNNKAFLARKKKEMALALADIFHIVAVESHLNYVWIYFDNRSPLHLYGTFTYAQWLLPDFYFRTLNKGVRVNMLHFLRFETKANLLFIVLTILNGEKKLPLDAANTKNINDLMALMLQPRFLEARKKL